jgi:hypothetical protein
VYFYVSHSGTKTRDPGDDPHEMAVVNGWDACERVLLDREGFALLNSARHSTIGKTTVVRAHFYGV